MLYQNDSLLYFVEGVYESSIQPFLSTLLDGYDVSVLSYGAKHTGKSYTLFGPGMEYILMVSILVNEFHESN